MFNPELFKHLPGMSLPQGGGLQKGGGMNFNQGFKLGAGGGLASGGGMAGIDHLSKDEWWFEDDELPLADKMKALEDAEMAKVAVNASSSVSSGLKPDIASQLGLKNSDFDHWVQNQPVSVKKVFNDTWSEATNSPRPVKLPKAFANVYSTHESDDDVVGNNEVVHQVKTKKGKAMTKKGMKSLKSKETNAKQRANKVLEQRLENLDNKEPTGSYTLATYGRTMSKLEQGLPNYSKAELKSLIRSMKKEGISIVTNKEKGNKSDATVTVLKERITKAYPQLLKQEGIVTPTVKTRGRSHSVATTHKHRSKSIAPSRSVSSVFSDISDGVDQIPIPPQLGNMFRKHRK